MKSASMSKFKQRRNFDGDFPAIKSTDEVFKPLSYYVLGGVDITGSEVSNRNANVTYDKEEALAEMVEQGKVSAIGVCSPDYDLFDIFEKSSSSVSSENGVKDDIKTSE